MSEEQLKAFLEVVKSDAALKEKLKGAGDADAVAIIAREVGYNISTKELHKSQQSDISERELEGIIGGKKMTLANCFCYDETRI